MNDAFDKPQVAVVDYGLGNLFSVRHVCEYVGMNATITSDRREIAAADAVILPGVGAYGDAMACLKRLDLVGPLREIALSGKPLLGVCLGQQLLMSESYEFGRHQGLNIIPGDVVRFDNPQGRRGPLKVPHVGWNRIAKPAGDERRWDHSPLDQRAEGEYMYFVHSFYVRPEDPSVVLATSKYGNVEFTAAVRRDNVVAFQFHPERSGRAGVAVYRRFCEMTAARKQADRGLRAAA
jgi:glutamine amidotransferase